MITYKVCLRPNDHQSYPNCVHSFQEGGAFFRCPSVSTDLFCSFAFSLSSLSYSRPLSLFLLNAQQFAVTRFTRALALLTKSCRSHFSLKTPLIYTLRTSFADESATGYRPQTPPVLFSLEVRGWDKYSLRSHAVASAEHARTYAHTHTHTHAHTHTRTHV